MRFKGYRNKYSHLKILGKIIFQIKPKIFNNQRYYDPDNIELLKYIKFLLKSEGLTILGAEKHLNQKSNLDDSLLTSIRTKYFKYKLSNVKKIIDKLKK